jgi:hypothetical protein
MRFNNINEAQTFYRKVFRVAMDIIGGRHSVWLGDRRTGRWYTPPATRGWYEREVNKYNIHPVIEYVIEHKLYRPLDWHQLLLEMPHRSTTDYNRLAYTRDDRAGDADRQVVTTVGKYLQRHFCMPDHDIRDAVALYTSAGDMEIRTTLDEIIYAVRNGPHSCMACDIQVTCSDGVRRHPYAVYKPELGWSIAVRLYEGRIDGRALIYNDDGEGNQYFVRSYKRDHSGGYSYADEALEAWLKAQGINKHGGWDGAVIAKYDVCGGYLAPYIDGDCQYVDPDRDTLRITDDSDFHECTNTNGVSNDCDRVECEDCGDSVDEDDTSWVGRWEDRRICCSCCDNDYTYAYSANGNQHYINNDDVTYVNSEYYDVNYLSDNDIVQLHDGEYEHRDNAVWIESCDEYYEEGDDDICYAEDTGRYELTEDCWLCDESNNWYTDDVDYIEVDGCKYHPDHAPEIDDEDDEVEVAAVTDVTIAAEPRVVAVTTNDSLTDSITYNYLRTAR